MTPILVVPYLKEFLLTPENVGIPDAPGHNFFGCDELFLVGNLDGTGLFSVRNRLVKPYHRCSWKLRISICAAGRARQHAYAA